MMSNLKQSLLDDIHNLGPTNKDVKRGFLQGYLKASWNYAIWHSGEQLCGVNTNFADIKQAALSILADLDEKERNDGDL